MKPEIKISEKVLQRLLKLEESCFGKLYGNIHNKTLIILGLQLNIENGINFSYAFPAEADFCGVFEAFDSTYDEQQVIKSTRDIDVTDNPVFVSVKLSARNKITTSLICNDHVKTVDYLTVSEQDILSHFVHINIKGKFPLKTVADEKCIEEAFQNLRKLVASGVIAFKIPKSNVFLLSNEREQNIVGLEGEPTIGEIINNTENSEGSNKRKKAQSLHLDILKMDMIRKVTRDSDNSNGKKVHAPVCVFDKSHHKFINMIITIDSLAMIHKDIKFANMYEILLEAAIRYLRLYENVFLNNLEIDDDKVEASALETFHFYPKDCGHFLTRIYPKNKSEGDLKKQREMLHKQLLLPFNAPVFRRANRDRFNNNNGKDSPLINPHEGVKATNNGGQVALVKGKYEYYHYSQNKMDDNGWGCAYRSLQTLASWYKLQGYIDRDVPDFKEIQKCLVDIGDKPSSFVGSKQWIGSTEVNFVLNTLFNITCKILYVSSGEEMASKGPELVNHFETQGTPVMIGGGVLAHTILGVDYNQTTGTLKFLILDPHYTGGEDLNVIQNKGWCGWKGADFWDKSAYYNMCLPQVPVEI